MSISKMICFSTNKKEIKWSLKLNNDKKKLYKQPSSVLTIVRADCILYNYLKFVVCNDVNRMKIMMRDSLRETISNRRSRLEILCTAKLHFTLSTFLPSFPTPLPVCLQAKQNYYAQLSCTKNYLWIREKSSLTVSRPYIVSVHFNTNEKKEKNTKWVKYNIESSLIVFFIKLILIKKGTTTKVSALESLKQSHEKHNKKRLHIYSTYTFALSLLRMLTAKECKNTRRRLKHV